MALTGIGRLGVMRLGSTRRPSLARLGMAEMVVHVLIGGTVRRARINGASITDELNHDPNVVSLRVEGTAPVQGQEIQIFVGDTAPAQQLFGGHILSVTHAYDADRPALKCWDIACIDYTWLLGRRPVLKAYGAQTASAVLTDLLATFSSGISPAGIDTLPVIDAITFTNEELQDAISRVMERVGGYWYVTYGKVLRAFLTETVSADPITQAVPRGMSNIRMQVDLSQVATRVTGRGGGSNALIERAIGETTLPVEDLSWYDPAGGIVEVGAQRLAYTSIVAGGPGSSVAGRGTSLPSAPAGALGASGVLRAGVYSYRTTFVIAGGETTAGTASSAVTITNVAAPTSTPSLTKSTGAGTLQLNKTYRYYVTFVTAAGETTVGPNQFTTLAGTQNEITVSLQVSGDARVTGRRLYRRNPDQTGIALVTTVADNTTTSWLDGAADSSLGAPPPGVDTGTGGRQIDVTSVTTGPAGTTARRLYRTAVDGTIYKLVGTISDNTTTTFTDNVADASLGAEPPVLSTVPAVAGATALPVNDLAPFPTDGWVRVGNQVLRYTGRFAGELTGIPASGTGAILAPLSLGSEVTLVPHLYGVTGLVNAIVKGDPVNVVVTVNDGAAQTAMAAWIGSGDGIHELFFSDGRFGLIELTARAMAILTARKDPHVVVTYDTRDPSTWSGRTVTITLTSPVISGTFRIQRVTFSHLGYGPDGGAFPLRSVECSSQRYSFEDLVRTIRGKVAA